MNAQETPSGSDIPLATGTSTFERLEAYPFSSDKEFQSGLSTILSTNTSQDPELLALRARCFYFARKFHVHIDFEAYKSWHRVQNLQPVANAPNTSESAAVAELPNDISLENPIRPSHESEQSAAPYPSSFSQIVELITKGEPIPGIKEIPDTLLWGQESAPMTAKRKKPWEMDTTSEDNFQKTLESHK
ncbi:MAG: hypothetical protein Q9182_000981 [Xanthomendoza sp. 2 TL-2023]